MLKVVKFGGSSLADANQYRKVKNIIEKDASRSIVVVSAAGKRFKDDNKITDLLYLCHAHIKYGVSYDHIFSLVEERYRSIVRDLNLDLDIEAVFKDIRSHLNKYASVDYIVSRGEYLSALCMSSYLGYKFLDAKDCIFFNFDSSFNSEKMKEALLSHAMEKIVVPGFYGAFPNGDIRVMSRGGSDITGSLLADIYNVDIYENWSDVSGILVADPRIIDNPRTISSITYNELRELSYMGANVLHDEAIFPVKAKNIPINIRNTNDPDHPGTMIMEDCSKMDALNPPHIITGIAGKKDFTTITIIKSGSSNEFGIMRKALQILENYKVKVNNIPCGIDSFSLMMPSESIKSCLYECLADLNRELQPDNIKVEDHLSLIATVGRGMVNSKGISGKLFAELGNNGINIKTISQGADELNIMVGVENADFEKTIKAIYEKFIR